MLAVDHEGQAAPPEIVPQGRGQLPEQVEAARGGSGPVRVHLRVACVRGEDLFCPCLCVEWGEGTVACWLAR